jgi:signal peptidase I
MFGIFQSKQKKQIETARHLLYCGKKVLDYRRDVLSPMIVLSIEKNIADLKALVAKRAEVPALESACNELYGLLTSHGGKIYPIKWIPDNVEVFLVAAIVAIGIRTFFFQPFTIPTNSMYPSFYGMTPHVYMPGQPTPNSVDAILRSITLGAARKNTLAPVSGEVQIPLFAPGDRFTGYSGYVRYNVVRGRKWFGLLPEMQREYILYVDGKPAEPIRVPIDFNLDSAVLQRYAPDYEVDRHVSESENFGQWMQERLYSGHVQVRGHDVRILTSDRISKGDPVLDFEILTGDTLFVDRITFHFCKPKIGESIVFRTRQIEGLNKANGSPSEIYYIKRLVGLPGDVLEIKAPVLFRNGEPIMGSSAFADNAQQFGLYSGYVNEGALAKGKTVTVKSGDGYALGDNSPNSGDSRFWTGVPLKEIVGRGVFIFYPLTSRWGPSK